jgi:hypothetical protein
MVSYVPGVATNPSRIIKVGDSAEGFKLTPCRRGLLEKLLLKFPAFYGTQRFITVFTRACDWTLS